MKKELMLATIAASVLFTAGCKKESESKAAADTAEVPVATEVTLASEDQKISYIFGMNMARQAKSFGVSIDVDALSQAVKDVASDSDPRMTDEEVRATMVAFQNAQREKQRVESEAKASVNVEKGKAFLAENATKDGVKQTESGLQYKVIEAGEGDSPKVEDTVVVHYRGTLLDGTEFDSSHKRNQPATFRVGDLIPGWIEALQMMKKGSKWEIYVPSDLAYGPGGTPNIGPNSTLIFEMEILDINPES